MMGTPTAYLPPALSADIIQDLLASLQLPPATSISRLEVTAEFHSIYLLRFTTSAAPQLTPARTTEADGSIVLVLRVSGRHLPRIKTLNEVAVMEWVRRNTSIPIPAVVRFDAAETNPTGHEFTLLEKCPGTSVDKIYDTLNETAKRELVSQLTDFLGQLHGHYWSHVGGLSLTEDGAIVPGQMLDETFWQAPDIAKYWGPDESVSSLNVTGPFQSYSAWCIAQLEKFAYAIARHPTLEPMRDLLPRIEALIPALQAKATELDDTKLILAHADLHFANVMVHPSDPGRITGILDWEFAGVVPAPRWNPPKAFLWNGQQSDTAKEEQERLWAVFEGLCAERGMKLLEDASLKGLQETMQTIVNYLRAIVEVCPRGQAVDKVGVWREVAEEAMGKFGV